MRNNIKVITGIVSCSARSEHAAAIRATFFSKLPAPFFFRGEPGAPSRRIGDTVILDCPDSYEHLPRKMFALYEHLLKHERFDYFLKLDDDSFVYTSPLKRFLANLRKQRPSLTHYMGARILSHLVPRSKVWHVGKVEDPSFNEEYAGTFENTYCSGGLGYILSRRAIEVIVETGRDHFLNEAEIYEDKCHGDVLSPAGYLPTQMPSGFVVTDLKPDQILALGKRKRKIGDKKLRFGDEKPVKGWIRMSDEKMLAALPFVARSVSLIQVTRLPRSMTATEVWCFFKECRRLLKPNGVLRLTISSLERLVQSSGNDSVARGNKPLPTIESTVANALANCSAVLGETTVASVLNALGFETRICKLNESDAPLLRDIDVAGDISSLSIEARRLPLPPSVNGQYGRHKKIAFLFLTRKNPNHCELWQEFLSNHHGEYSLYTHAKHPQLVDNTLWQRTLIPEYFSTSWGGLSLVQATLALLTNALRDPLNVRFALVSESCIPIKPFSVVRNTLFSESRGWMSWQEPDEVAIDNPEKARRLAKAHRLPKAFWKYQSQWFVFTREIANTILDNDRVRDFEGVFAADECYFASLIASLGLDLMRMFVNNSLTHTDWENSEDGAHPYNYDTLSSEMISQFRDSPCLFARKFASTSNIRSAGLHLPLM